MGIDFGCDAGVAAVVVGFVAGDAVGDVTGAVFASCFGTEASGDADAGTVITMMVFWSLILNPRSGTFAG